MRYHPTVMLSRCFSKLRKNRYRNSSAVQLPRLLNSTEMRPPRKGRSRQWAQLAGITHDTLVKRHSFDLSQYKGSVAADAGRSLDSSDPVGRAACRISLLWDRRFLGIRQRNLLALG